MEETQENCVNEISENCAIVYVNDEDDLKFLNLLKSWNLDKVYSLLKSNI